MKEVNLLTIKILDEICIISYFFQTESHKTPLPTQKYQIYPGDALWTQTTQLS